MTTEISTDAELISRLVSTQPTPAECLVAAARIEQLAAQMADARKGQNALIEARDTMERCWKETRTRAEAALPAVSAPVAVRVRELEWDADGRKLHMDQSMAFSKSYDWDGWDCFRQEGYGLGASYIIWPDSIGSARWNLYGTVDGLFIPDLNGETAAKAAAQADYAARIMAAIEVVDVAELVEALRQFAAHYPRGINPFLDDAHSKARAALARIGGQ
jgi:hypothetical protein